MRARLAALVLPLLVACSGGGATDVPDAKLILGDWVQVETENTEAERLENSRVTYADDGTSVSTGRIVIDNPAIPEAARRYDMRADVTWSIVESVLTRELQSVELTPVTVTPQSTEFADLYEAGLMRNDRVTYLIQDLDAERLVLLNPESNETVEYRR